VARPRLEKVHRIILSFGKHRIRRAGRPQKKVLLQGKGSFPPTRDQNGLTRAKPEAERVEAKTVG